MHEHVSAGAPGPRHSRRGIVLPVALAVLFVMLMLALGLAQQGQSMLQTAQLAEADALQMETAQVVFSDMQSVLQGDTQPALLGGLSTFPLAGSPTTARFYGRSGLPLSMGGQFNGGGTTESANNVVDPQAQAQARAQLSNVWTLPGGFTSYLPSVGYASTYTGSQTKVAVPAGHVLAIAGRQNGAANQTGVEINTGREFLAMFSEAYPYGIVAPQGAIRVNGSARSVGSLAGQDTDESGVPVALRALNGVQVTGFLNGRAYSWNAANQLASGGVSFSGCPTDATTPSQSVFPAAFDLTVTSPTPSPINQARTLLCQGLTQLTFTNFGGTMPTTTAYTLQNNVVTTNGSFVVPNRAAVEVPGAMTVNGDLGVGLLQTAGTGSATCAVLHVKGDLTVAGNLYLNDYASLVVDGSLAVQGVLYSCTAIPANATVLESVWTGVNATLTQGTLLASGVTYQPYTVSALPVPGSGTWSASQAQQFQSQAASNAAAIAPYCANILATTTGAGLVPGVSVAAGGLLTVAGGQKAAGLFVAVGDIRIQAARTVGVAYSRQGNVTVQEYRYFPYFTTAYFHATQIPVGALPIAARRFHRTAFGRLMP